MSARKPTGKVSIGGLDYPFAPMTISQMVDAEPAIRRQQEVGAKADATMREKIGPLIDLLVVCLSRFTPDLTAETLWEAETSAVELQTAMTTIMVSSGYIRTGGPSQGEAKAPASPSTSTTSTAPSRRGAATRRAKSTK